MTLHDLVARDLGVGIGLRAVHYGDVLEKRPPLDWFEILSENYMNTGGRPLHVLDQVAERYPIVMHGVSMNIGSTDELDFGYLAELKQLRGRCGAVFVSDHLCWTGVQGRNLHDLLPLPYRDDVLEHVARRVRQVQDFLEAPLILENPSTYLEFADSSMAEWEFLGELAHATGCGLLLDINNVYVCARNHGFDPYEYVANVPWDHVVQFHLAGHTDHGTHLLDTHSGPACEDVWKLYEFAHRRSGGRSTLFEWDAEIPDLDEVRAEAEKARAIRTQPQTTGVAK